MTVNVKYIKNQNHIIGILLITQLHENFMQEYMNNWSQVLKVTNGLDSNWTKFFLN